MRLIIFISGLVIEILIVFFLFKNNFKDEKDTFARIAMLLGIISIILPSTIYLADFYNISEFLNVRGTINSVEWFQFAAMFVSSISGACMSGVILYLFNQQQLNYQKHENSKSKRIENAPLMKYIITESSNQDFVFSHQINLINDDAYDYSILLNVANIGLNHAKHIKFEIPDIEGAEDNSFYLDGCQSILKKDSDIWICLDFQFKYKKDKTEKIKIICFYEDMLNNKYKQEIRFDVTLTNCSNGYFYLMPIVDNTLNVENEELIEEAR